MPYGLACMSSVITGGGIGYVTHLILKAHPAGRKRRGRERCVRFREAYVIIHSHPVSGRCILTVDVHAAAHDDNGKYKERTDRGIFHESNLL